MLFCFLRGSLPNEGAWRAKARGKGEKTESRGLEMSFGVLVASFWGTEEKGWGAQEEGM